MTYWFEGQEFASIAAFKRAYPKYSSYSDHMRDGATTIAEMERRISTARAAGARLAREAAKRSNQRILKARGKRGRPS